MIRSTSRVIPIVIGIFLLILCFSTGCSTQKSDASATAVRSVPVSVATASTRDMPVTVSAIGIVTPLQTVQVKSMVTAAVVKVHIAPGQEVKTGQLLFTLDSRTFEADLAKAKGNLARDQAAAANAETVLKRHKQLLQEGVIAQQEYDQQESSAAQFDAAVEADKAAVQSAQVNLQYTKIYSPCDGRAGDLLIHEGNIIKANDLALVVINKISPIYANFAIPEKFLPQIKANLSGLRAVATLPDSADKLAEGKVSFVDNTVDRTTGTIGLKAEFANSDRKLWPGQYVRVSLQLNTIKNATLVPSQALQNGQQGIFVFVVKPDKTVEQRIVEIGPADNVNTVIYKGVASGEMVVTDGQVRIVPGSRVEWKSPDTKGAAEQSGSERQS